MSRRKLVVGNGVFSSYSTTTHTDIPFQTMGGDDHPNVKFGTVHSDDLMRWKYMFIFFNGMLGVFLMLLELQVAWDGAKRELVWSRASRTLRFLITFLTILLIVQLLDYYNGLLALMTKPWKDAEANLGFNISGWNVLQSSLVAPLFWGEVLVCILHAPPFPGIDDKVGLFMFARFYMAFRLIKDHSTIYRSRNTIMRKYAKFGIKHWGPPKFSWVISAKTLFYRRPFLFVTSVTLWVLWVCGHCIYIFEREGENADRFTYEGSLYLSLISMITGWPTDTYEYFWPVTVMGRAACIMSTLVGLWLLSLMLEVLSTYVVPTPHQRPAMIWSHRHDIKHELRDSAARIIQLVWKRYAIASQKRHTFKSDKSRLGYNIPLGARYMQAVKAFRSLMRQKIALQIQYADAQHKDIADPDEHTRNYSDDDYDSYAQDTGHGEVEERLKAMELMIQSLTQKIDTLMSNSNNHPPAGAGAGGTSRDRDSYL